MKQTKLFQGSEEIIKHPEKQRRMGRSFCPICGPKNTFIIDNIGQWEIRLCLECAKKEGYEIDISKASKCEKCKELFIQRRSSTCPVCWIEYFKEEKK